MKKLIQLTLLISGLMSLPAWAFEPFSIKSIQIKGLKSISKEAVLQAAGVKVNDKLDQDQADSIIRQLYTTGFFKDVRLEVEARQLIIVVSERPILSQLTIKGIKDSSKLTEIMQKEGLIEGRMFDPLILSRTQRALELHYLSKGRYGVRIDTHVRPTPDKQMSVTLEIYEGSIARIKQIKIIGAHVFNERDLKKNFLQKSTHYLSWLTKDDQYVKEKLQADQESLRSYYMDRGYVDFQIESSQVSLSPDKQAVYLTINIKEGEQYRLGKVIISGDTLVPRAQFKDALSRLKPQDIFSTRTVLEVREAIEAILGTSGYSLAEVRPMREKNDLTRTVDIDFHLVPQNKVYVRRITISGNDTTQDEVLRRELPQMEGTWINTVLVKEGKEKLIRQGYATEVEIALRKVLGLSDQFDVDYKIEESKVREFSASIGWSAEEHLMFRLALTQQNFLGTGKNIDFAFDKSRTATNYQLGYQDPHYTIDGIGLGANVYYNKTEMAKATEVSDYSTDTYGTNINIAFPLSSVEALRIGLGYDRTRLNTQDNHAVEITNFVALYGHHYAELSVTGGWSVDTRDRPIMPTKGYMHNLSFRATLPNAKLNYYRMTYDTKWYRPLNDDYILTLASQLGYGAGYGKTHGLPFFRNFFAGGIGSVRGFKENSLGPRDSKNLPFGGNLLLSGTTGLIVPTPFAKDIKTLRSSVFFDIGQVYDTHFKTMTINGVTRHRNQTGLRYAVGVGVDWQTPFGAPLHISISRTLKKRYGDARQMTAFTFGSQF